MELFQDIVYRLKVQYLIIHRVLVDLQLLACLVSQV